MRLPAPPYFSDSRIELETRPTELRSKHPAELRTSRGASWAQAMLTGIVLGAAIALMGFWLDSMG